MNTVFAIVIIVLVLAVLVIFLIIRNKKDEKEFEEQLKKDYHKPKVHDTDEGEKERI